MKSSKIKITEDFNEEALKVATLVRELANIQEKLISDLYERAVKEDWYYGEDIYAQADAVIEEYLWDYCHSSTTRRSWLNFVGAELIE